jgi:hypothetical protein
VAHNRHFICVEDDVHRALQNAALEEDLVRAAALFANQIKATMAATETKKHFRKSHKHWLHTFERFLARLYPVARFSSRLTGALAEVHPDCPVLFLI